MFKKNQILAVFLFLPVFVQKSRKMPKCLVISCDWILQVVTSVQ